MKTKISKLCSLFAAVLIVLPVLAACGPAPASANPTDTANAADTTGMTDTSSGESLALRQAMRKLWEDHITWTRVYIISAVAGLPDADAAAERLLQNQTDIGNAVKPYYGEEAGTQLTALLEDHILTAVDLIAAAKSGDAAAVEEASQRWYANGDEIAAFLSSANPDHWPLSDMQAMMKSHLDLTLAEATARINEDWAGDVAVYDQVHEQILHMADMLADGIIAQFHEMF